MAIPDEIYATAAVFLGGQDERERAALMGLCKAAEAGLCARLRPGLTPDDCREALVCAAAWIALGQYAAGMQSDGVASFAAGDLKVTKQAAAAIACLQTQAELLMAPYLRDSFRFRGVRA